MILQALVEHYEDLLKQGRIAKPGWGKVKVADNCHKFDGKPEHVHYANYVCIDLHFRKNGRMFRFRLANTLQ